MNERGNGKIPILRPGQPEPRLIGGLAALLRKIDPDGATTAGRVLVGPDGEKHALPLREQFVDAEELVQMIADEVEKRLVRLLSRPRPSSSIG